MPCFWCSFFVPLFAARNGQRFLLPSDVGGGVQLRGEGCDVTWTEASGSQLQLTIKAEGKKTISMARVIEREQLGGGVEAVFSTGVTYLLAFHTTNATFMIQDAPKDLK